MYALQAYAVVQFFNARILLFLWPSSARIDIVVLDIFSRGAWCVQFSGKEYLFR